MFPEQPILFFYITDPVCKKNRGLNEGDDASIVLYVEKEIQPFVLNSSNDAIDFERLYWWISLSISQSKM